MTEHPKPPTPSAERRPNRWRRWAKRLAIALPIALVGGYFLLTSSFFLRTVLVPAVARAVGRPISVEQITWRPFSRIELSELTVGGPKADPDTPLLTCQALAVRYRFWSILRGRPHIVSATVEDPRLAVIVYPDGRTSIDDLLGEPAAPSSPSVKPSSPTPATVPIQVDYVQVNGGTLEVTRTESADTSPALYRLSDLDLSLTDLAPGREGMFQVEVYFAADDPAQNLRIDRARGLLQARMALDDRLRLAGLSGTVTVNRFEGAARDVPLEEYAIDGQWQLTQTEDLLALTSTTLTLKKGIRVGAMVAADGEIRFDDGAGELRLEATDIDKTLLNPLGSRVEPVDFRNTQARFLTVVVMENQFQRFTVHSEGDISDFSILTAALNNRPTEEIDVTFRQAGLYDAEGQVVQLDAFDITGVRQGVAFLQGRLTEPLTLQLAPRADGDDGPEDIRFDLALTDFDLAPYASLLPLPPDARLRSGVLRSNAAIVFGENGQRIAVQITGGLRGLSGAIGDFAVENTDIAWDADGTIDDLTAISIAKADVTLAQQGLGDSRVSLTGTADLAQGRADLESEISDLDLRWSRLAVPAEQLLVNQGSARGQIALTARDDFSDLRVTGQVEVDRFSGTVAGWAINGLGVQGPFDVALRELQALDIEAFALDLTAGGAPAGTVRLSGTADLADLSAELDLEMANMNHRLAQVLDEQRTAQWPMSAWTWDYSGTVTAGADLASLASAGTFQAGGVTLKPDFAPPGAPPYAIQGEYDVAWLPERLTARSLEITVSQAGVGADQSPHISAQGDVDLKEGGAGVIIVRAAQVDQRLVAPLAALFVPTVQVHALILSAEQDLRFTDGFNDLHITGTMDVGRFTGTVAGWEVNDLGVQGPFDVSLRELQSLDIEKFALYLTADRAHVGEIRLSGNAQLADLSAALQLEAQGVNHRLAQVLDKRLTDQLPLETWTWDYNGSVTVGAEVASIASAGTFQAGDVTLKPAFSEAGATPYSIAGEYDVAWRPDHVTARSLEMTVTQAGVAADAAPRITAEGEMNLATGAGDVALRAARVDQRLVAPLAALFAPTIQVRSLTLDAEQDLRFADGFTDLDATGRVVVTNLRLTDSATNLPLAVPMSLRLANRVSIQDGEGTLDGLELALQAQGKPEETIAITGSVRLPSADSLRPVYTLVTNVTAPRLTVDHYLPPVPTPPPGAAAGAQGPAEPRQDPEPLDLGFLDLASNIQIDHLQYGDIATTGVTMALTVRDSVLVVTDGRAYPPGGPATLAAQVDFKTAGWTYAINGSTRNVLVAPIVDTFVPTQAGSLTGRATMNLRLEGQGLSQTSLEQRLRGAVQGELHDGVLRRIPIVTALSEVTRIPQLAELRYFRTVVDADIAQGRITLNTLDLLGSLQKVGARGWIGFNQDIDLSLQVALSGSYAREVDRMNIVGRLLLDDDGFAPLPVPVGMGGTLSRPRPTFNIQSALEETGQRVIEGLLEEQLQRQTERLLERLF